MKFKLPTIPDDDDAKGIVVRVISYEYYLKKFWLTFIDPYIEVEYQISIRRERLITLLFISFYHFIFGLHNLLANHIYTANINKDFAHLYYIFGAIWIFIAFSTVILLFQKNISSIINLPYLSIGVSLFMSCTFIFLTFREMITIPDIINEMNFKVSIDVYKFMSQVISGNNNIFSIYLINILIQFLLFTFILDVRNFMIFGGSFTFFVCFLFYFMFANFKYDFKELYDGFGWRLGIFFHPIIVGFLKKDLNLEQAYMQVSKIVNGTEILQEQIKTVMPYKNSIFNLSDNYYNLMKNYIYIWILYSCILFFIVYTNEKKLRADFILRRIRSDKDKPRNLEIGIKVKSLNDINRTEEENIICANNLNRWKKKSDKDSDESIINLSEIESDINKIDLNEMGSILDGKTVKSFISDSTFKNDKNEIVDIVKTIFPKSYTKSEISNNDTDLDEMGSVLDGKTVKSFISDSTFKNDKNEIVDSVKKMIPKSYTKSEVSNNDSEINDIKSDRKIDINILTA